METLKIIFWIVSWFFAVGVIISFLRGAKNDDPSELNARDRYEATAMLEKEIEDSNNNVMF